MNKANECTCPSGDGSLRHPCPAHQASVEQAGGDERSAFKTAYLAEFDCDADGDDNMAHSNTAWRAWKMARAALAQPSPKCSTCGGTGMVDDGEIDCYSDGTPFENGPVKCVKDCPACKAQPSPAQAEQHWPKLEKPAQVGAICFSAGVSSRLVVEAAQRLYEFESTPEKEAERIERLQAFREQLDPLNLAPHAEAFNEAPDEALRPEQAEAERSALWAVHAQGPDELYAAFSREDAEKHAAELNALPMPEGIAVGAVVVPSPWPAVQHWQYLAEQEQDHKNEIAGRLRQHERIGEALRADRDSWAEQAEQRLADWDEMRKERDAALARVAELTATRNRYGVDAHYFNKNLQRILRDFESFTPDELARSLIILAKVADEKVVAQAQHSVPELLEWAVGRWHAEVSLRPLINVHRRALDDTWRQVIRRLGGDTGLLCGPSHDELLAAALGKEGV
ncbi:hypothetical protein [Pseudomonas aeruginosa]|uniref:hypothetical protein n=1 Tax=Pseudomonas aeruginosa TaxID=287 RepID=UPI0015F0CF94|nr:hypothetical protein [Pseudomonas aeruginosa]